MSAAALIFIAIEPCDSPCFVRGPYTLESLCAAPMFSVFKGDVPDPGPVVWEVFDIDGTLGDTGAASEITGLIVTGSEPERDDDDCEGTRYTDEDAWLAFLRAGGTVCKVPDEEGSPFYRMLVVQL